MYTYIKGLLVSSSPTKAIVEAGGLGYSIDIPSSAHTQLPQIGSEVQLHLSYVVRETSQTLFGFPSPGERELFNTLIGVSGVGPKLALAMVGHLPLKDLQQAIAGSDIRTISRVPGIGKRTAERLIVELRDKLPGLFPRDLAESSTSATASGLQLVNDALSALTNLGYTQAMAQKAVDNCRQEVEDNISLPELISAILKKI